MSWYIHPLSSGAKLVFNSPPAPGLAAALTYELGAKENKDGTTFSVRRKHGKEELESWANHTLEIDTDPPIPAPLDHNRELLVSDHVREFRDGSIRVVLPKGVGHNLMVALGAHQVGHYMTKDAYRVPARNASRIREIHEQLERLNGSSLMMSSVRRKEGISFWEKVKEILHMKLW